MKFKFLDIRGVFILALSLMGVSPAFAQDGLPTPMSEVKEINLHPELNLNDDKVLISEPSEQKPNGAAASKEVSASVAKSVKPKTGEGSKTTADKKEQDPLSFNFLYYLIQRVKFSDMMDE
jgi:hypothetical protein